MSWLSGFFDFNNTKEPGMSIYDRALEDEARYRYLARPLSPDELKTLRQARLVLDGLERELEREGARDLTV